MKSSAAAPRAAATASLRAPAMTVHQPEPASAARDEGEGGGAAAVLHHGNGFAGEDMRVA